MNIRSIASVKPVSVARKRLTPQEAVQLASAMVPRLAERAAEAERLRRIPQATIDELHASGLMRLMQPARFGGSELGLDALMNVVTESAKGCTSSAWVYSNLASHSWNIGQFDLRDVLTLVLSHDFLLVGNYTGGRANHTPSNCGCN